MTEIRYKTVANAAEWLVLQGTLLKHKIRGLQTRAASNPAWLMMARKRYITLVQSEDYVVKYSNFKKVNLIIISEFEFQVRHF